MNLNTFKDIRFIRVVITVTSLFILTWCFSEYREHFQSEHSSTRPISWEYRLSVLDEDILVLPDKKIKDTIINSIHNARKRIWIEIYTWTDKDIMNAMVDAHKRWVDVRVLLERNVYSLPRVNIPVYSTLQEAWIPIKYTDSYRFTFTHAKFWIIDDRYFISTGNLTKSFFESNRDFIFHSSDISTLDFLSSLFLWDFSYLGIDNSTIPNHIILSPVDSRSKIEYLLGRAQEEIILYTQTLTDKALIDLIEEKYENWVKVHICTADNESNRESSSGVFIPWSLSKKPYLHGKIVFVDWKNIVLWSQNLTSNSLENNREVGIILSDSWTIYSRLFDFYKNDCIFD